MTNTNGTKPIFGVLPGAGGLATQETSWEIIERAFDYAFRTFPEADLGWVPTIEQATEIRTNAVIPAVRSRDEARPSHRPGKSCSIPSNYDAERIQGMFKQWRLYYPFVDKVAVNRAVNFHSDAWKALTTREHRLAVKRLATMWDPWEDNNIIHGRPQRANGDGKRTVTTVTERATRWMSFPPKERKVLFDLVQRQKKTDGV
jgi:hypothetical protein